MKKYVIGIGSFLLIASAAIILVSATNSKEDPKKAKGEAAKTEAALPCSATCSTPCGESDAACDTEASPVARDSKCDPATCPAHEDGKCDPASCTSHKDGKCDPATCPAHTDGKCDPATCSAHKEGTAKECPAATTCKGKCHSSAE